MLMWRRCAIGVPSSQRFGLMTQNGAVKEPPKKIDPLNRTARSISESTSDPPARTGRAGVSANEGGVPVIVDMALDEDNHAQSSGWPGRFWDAGRDDRAIPQEEHPMSIHAL